MDSAWFRCGRRVCPKNFGSGCRRPPPSAEGLWFSPTLVGGLPAPSAPVSRLVGVFFSPPRGAIVAVFFSPFGGVARRQCFRSACLRPLLCRVFLPLVCFEPSPGGVVKKFWPRYPVFPRPMPTKGVGALPSGGLILVPPSICVCLSQFFKENSRGVPKISKCRAACKPPTKSISGIK